MSLLLVIAIWTGVSAICAPLIGRFLFAMHMDGSTSLGVPVQHPISGAPRYFERRQMHLAAWPRRALRPSRVI
jgi:hypothetical protein